MKTSRERQKELLRGNTPSLLLYLIAKSGRIHGYRLIKEVGRRSKGYFRFRAGTVYPVLHKLEQEGLIKGEWDSQAGRQSRRHYTITEKGRKALSRRLTTWAEFTAAMNLVLQAEGS
jgi:DNA-binding PadR family transcriptional regulator